MAGSFSDFLGDLVNLSYYVSSSGGPIPADLFQL